MDASQEQLDAWLGTSAADRGSMREGRLPERMSKFLSSGCLAFLAVPFGAGAGVMVALFARDFGPIHDVPDVTLLGGGGLVGAALAYSLVRARMAGKAAVAPVLRMAVRSELVEVTAMQTAPYHALLTDAGRRYRLVRPPPPGLDLRGRVRVFFVDPAEMRGDANVESEPMVVGLELP